MRKLRLLSLATVVAAAAAFAAVAAASVQAGTYTATVTSANAPNGTHFGNRSSAPTCVVASDLSISCGDGAAADQSYTLQGVGHTDATLNLVATYNETISCTNGGNHVVVAQQKTASSGATTLTPSRKNGSMTVPATGVTAPAVGSTHKGSPCPNRNWTATVSDVTLHSFDYTLAFDGFPGPYVEIRATDP